MNIAFFEIEDWEKSYIQEKLQAHKLYFYTQPLTDENIGAIKDVEAISIFLYSSLNDTILSQLPNLKYIVTRSTGFDHIPLDICKKRNISVSNVPEYGTHTVAEHAFALLLALTRNIIPSVERARKGDFSLDSLRGMDLYGKTIGVIGTGNIGQAVIQIAKSFGMRVLAHNRAEHADIAQKLDFSYVSLESLLSQSDVITLHLSFNPETQHIINKENIRKFKKKSILLNTARGGLIDTEAILIGLDEGYLRAVGLDVLEEECFVKEERQLLTEQFLKECNIKTQLLNHVLLTKENVLITPHNAFNSDEALQRILDVTLDDLLAYINGKMQNVVS